MNLSLRRGSFNQIKFIQLELNISKIFLKEKLELMMTDFHEMIFWKFLGDPSTLTQPSRDIDQCVVSGTWIQKKGTQKLHGYD